VNERGRRSRWIPHVITAGHVLVIVTANWWPLNHVLGIIDGFSIELALRCLTLVRLGMHCFVGRGGVAVVTVTISSVRSTGIPLGDLFIDRFSFFSDWRWRRRGVSTWPSRLLATFVFLVVFLMASSSTTSRAQNFGWWCFVLSWRRPHWWRGDRLSLSHHTLRRRWEMMKLWLVLVRILLRVWMRMLLRHKLVSRPRLLGFGCVNNSSKFC
jgi:hypothetical protein